MKSFIPVDWSMAELRVVTSVMNKSGVKTIDEALRQMMFGQRFGTKDMKLPTNAAHDWFLLGGLTRVCKKCGCRVVSVRRPPGRLTWDSKFLSFSSDDGTKPTDPCPETVRRIMST